MLAHEVASKQALIPSILPFLLSDGGEVTISRSSSTSDYVNEYARELEEEESINIDQLLTVYSNYHSRKEINGMIPGWGNCSYIRTDVCIPLKMIA